MISPAWYLALEALFVLAVVIGVHALRRKTSLVYSYALVACMRIGSWAATHQSMVSVGPLHLNVGSSVFFSATLLGVFLLYVADGRTAGRLGLGVVVGTGVLYTGASMLLHAQFPDQTATIFPDSGVRANLGSIVASLVDLVVLGAVWEQTGPRGGAKLPLSLGLLLRVFSTLAAVFVADTLVYVSIAWAGGAGFSAELGGNLLGRLLVAAACAPFVTLYLGYEIRRHGLVLGRRAALSILLKEDAERELLAAQHQLRRGTEALWESEERYRRMVDDIPVMVFRFSVEGLVTYANRALCGYYGREADEILGLHVLTPIEEGQRDDLWRKVMGLNAGAPTTEFTAHATPSRGKLSGQRRLQRWVVRGIFSPRGGGGLAFQAVGEDITDRLELEGKLLQAQRMEAIGRLAGGVAHDFNNLIAVIWACGEAASRSLSKLPSDLTGPITEDLVDIRKSADRAALLTRQLSTVSRKEAIRPRPLDVAEVVQNLSTLLKRLLPKEISLELRGAAPLPKVLIDPIQLERVIVNLVSNARDAMPGGGVLTVSTTTKTLGAGDLDEQPEARRRAHVVLTVADRGLGMDPETCARIFEPFFTTKPEERGTGLGLSTVYGIVQQAGGHIRVQSAPGAGTTFTVYLPIDETPASTPVWSSRERAARPVILYCENEEDVRTQVVQLLGNEGYRIVCTRNAAETLAQLREQPSLAPGVLLTDMVTSGMSGPELAVAVRALRPDLPVAILSGASPDGKRRDGTDGHWYVNKRYWRSALLAAVDEAMRSVAPVRKPSSS